MKAIIIGSGVSGWLTALALAPFMGSVISDIRVLNDGTSEDVPPVLVAFPRAISILERLSLAQTDLLLHAGASFHLGHAYSGWQKEQEAYFVGVGETKAPLGSVSFAQLALRASADGKPIRLSDYSLEALCAQAGRFAFANPDPRSVLSTLVHGLHIENQGLIDLAKRKALALGVTEDRIKFGSVVKNPHGMVQHIDCADLGPVQGDMFIDCSGTQRLATSSQFVDWSHQWPSFNVNWSRQVRANGPLPLFVHSDANGQGWSTKMSTQQNHYVMQANFDVSASAKLGRLQEVWRGNCLAIGNSAASLPPHATLDLQTILTGIDLLLRLLPTSSVHDTEAGEYNRIFGAQLDQAHAWAAMPFARNQRNDSVHWEKARKLSTHPLLAPIINVWSKLGRIARPEDDWFDESAWLSMLWGSGALPAKYDAVADTLSDASIQAHLAKIRDTMLASIARLPAHEAYISSVIGHLKAEQAA